MITKTLSASPEDLELAATALREGDIVAIPTETVYGLAGAAFREDVVAKIFDSKERPTFDPLIVHIGLAHAPNRTVEELEKARLVYAGYLSPLARERAHLLMKKFWPGPLTLVLPKHPSVPDLVTSELPTIALRMPRHPVAQSLIAAAKTPLAAPSANRFGRISPTTALAVHEELNGRIRYIVDGGTCEVGLESSVVLIETSGDVRLLRHGGIPIEEIETCLGLELDLQAPPSKEQAASSPGMLESHYAPKKRLDLLPKAVAAMSAAEILAAVPKDLGSGSLGMLIQSGGAAAAEVAFAKVTGRKVIAKSLSVTGDLQEAARRLFAEMRFLDSSEAILLLAELPAKTEGLGHAIADRLKRAAGKR